MAQRRMITLDAGTDHFSHRVAGLAVEDGQILLHSATHESGTERIVWREKPAVSPVP